MGSRVKKECSRLFELFAHIESVDDAQPVISLLYPASTSDQELIECLPKFAFPVSDDSVGDGVDHFSFVLTDISSKFRFGFCRLAADYESCFCIVSYLPWFEVFFRLLNYVSDIMKCLSDESELHDVTSLLERLMSADVSKPLHHVEVMPPCSGLAFRFTCPASDIMPSIPENRNLMEYYSAIDVNNMISVFASLLFERRILITSRRLGRLTACVHAAAALIYPLHWQQIFIPALPEYLIDYCTAPVPYLIGVHSSLLTPAVLSMLEGVILLDADDNRVISSYDDAASLPNKLVKYLTKRLKTRQSFLLGDTVSRAFFNALVLLIGDYHSAVSKREDGRMTFNSDVFVTSRSAKYRPMLTALLSSQAFHQFIDERVDILNSSGAPPQDMFEDAISHYREIGSSARTPTKKERTQRGDVSTKYLSKFASKVSIKPLKKFGQVLGFDMKTTSSQSSRRQRHSHHSPARSYGRDDMDLYRPTSPQLQRLLSTEESDALLEAVLTQRTTILSDPEVQMVLRKSYSLDDLIEADLPDVNTRSGSVSELSEVEALESLDDGDKPDTSNMWQHLSSHQVNVEAGPRVDTTTSDDVSTQTVDNPDKSVDCEVNPSNSKVIDELLSKPTSFTLPSHVKLLVSELESRYSTSVDRPIQPAPTLQSCPKITTLRNTLLSRAKDTESFKSSTPILQNSRNVVEIRDTLMSRVHVPETSKMTSPPVVQSCPKIAALQETLICRVQDPGTSQTSRVVKQDLAHCPSVASRQTALLGAARSAPSQRRMTASDLSSLRYMPSNSTDGPKDGLSNSRDELEMDRLKNFSSLMNASANSQNKPEDGLPSSRDGPETNVPKKYSSLRSASSNCIDGPEDRLPNSTDGLEKDRPNDVLSDCQDVLIDRLSVSGQEQGDVLPNDRDGPKQERLEDGLSKEREVQEDELLNCGDGPDYGFSDLKNLSDGEPLNSGDKVDNGLS